MSRSIHSPVITHKIRIVHWYKPQKTYAKEKLSTFCTDATAVPFIVIFVRGVLCNVWLPYQSIASTEAWPPSQLQLMSASPACQIGSALESHRSAQFIPKSAFSIWNRPALIIGGEEFSHPWNWSQLSVLRVSADLSLTSPVCQKLNVSVNEDLIQWDYRQTLTKSSYGGSGHSP